MTDLTIQRATQDDLEDAAALFDAYRVFYEQPSDPELARSFLARRLTNNESVFALARAGGQPGGFVQLYPMFSSVSAGRVWILNDLFVHPDHRRRGIARTLLEWSASFARGDGALRLVLQTAEDNSAAQHLYESFGFNRETGFREYALPL